jgi:DNA-binding SARP family transcriptional activator
MTSTSDDAQIRLTLLGGFCLAREAEEIELAMSAQRLVALLALRERPLNRAYLAGVLWPDYSTERSVANLRTALWRANRSGTFVVAATGTRLRLCTNIQVDVQALTAFGREVDNEAGKGLDLLLHMPWFELSRDLLPDWYDDWLVDDREGIRQLRLHALERLSEALSTSGRHGEAIQAALTAVRLEPLRETAHATLIKAHLAEGNWSEALRQFSRCREALAAELAVEPSDSMQRLVSCGGISFGSMHAGSPAAALSNSSETLINPLSPAVNA